MALCELFVTMDSRCEARIWGRRRTKTILSVAILLATSVRVFALDPSLDVSQYAHTAWKIRDGFTKGTIFSMAQTPDGYLWLSTEFGLVRFDGVQASRGSRQQVSNFPAITFRTCWLRATVLFGSPR